VPPIPDPPQPLTDGAVALRLAAERDIPEILIAHQDDLGLHGHLGMDRPPSGAQLGREMEEDPTARSIGSSLMLTIVEPSADVCLGQVRAGPLEWEHARADLEIWLAPAARGKGLAQQALRLAAEWLLSACPLERLQLLVEPDNEPMLRTARAAGFADEGILRGHKRLRGARIDCAVLSLLPSDLAR
jgi:RimJ/RimL family protein N-acetyltransferase